MMTECFFLVGFDCEEKNKTHFLNSFFLDSVKLDILPLLVDNSSHKLNTTQY